MSAVRIMTSNYIDSDVMANYYVSSEQTSFSDENTFNGVRRTKLWRSQGYWVIDATNYQIVFQETDGVDLTATLTQTTYTSTTALLAEIKTKMEAVGGSTYTIVQDTSTFKIKFTSNGVGGGGLLKLRWTQCTTIADELGFDNSADDTGALTYTTDELKLAHNEWLKWDFGLPTNPMGFILIGKRNESIQIASDAVIKLKGNATDAWSSPSYDQTLTYNDNAISIFDEDGLHTEGLRYWRIYIEDLANPNGYTQISNVCLGDYFNPVRGRAQFPFGAKYIDRTSTVFSKSGVSYSDIRNRSEEFTINWYGLTIADKEELDTFFNSVGTGTPFIISFDPDAVFSSTSNYYIRYCKFSGEPSYKLESPGVFSLNMDLREEI